MKSSLFAGFFSGVGHQSAMNFAPSFTDVVQMIEQFVVNVAFFVMVGSQIGFFQSC